MGDASPIPSAGPPIAASAGAFAAAFADDRFVRAVAKRLVRDAADADDLVQDAWLAALRRRPEPRPTLRAWFARVLTRAAINRARGDARRARRDHAAARPEAVPPEQALLEREEVRRRLVAAVVGLGAPQSTVFVLRYFEELPPREIARRLDLPVETVRTHLKRGHAKLRERLGGERDLRGQSVLGLLPCLLPRGDLAALLFGAAVVTAKTKIASALVVVGCVVGGWMYATRETPVPAPPPPIARGVPNEPAPPVRVVAEAPASAPVERAPFVDAAPTSAPAAAPTPEAGVACAVRGVVRDPDGRPVAGCDVFVAVDAEDAYASEPTYFAALVSERPVDALRRGHDDRWSRLLRTDADGRFEAVGLPASDRGVAAALHPDYGVVVASGIPVRAERAADVALAFPAGTILVGRVTDELDRPVARQMVHVSGEFEARYTTFLVGVLTDADGAYRTPPFSRRSASAQIQRKGYKFAHRSTPVLRPEDREARLDFKLERAPEMGGRLVTATGAPAGLARRLEERGLRASDADVVVIGSHDDPATAPNFRDIGRDEGVVGLADDTWTLAPDGDVPPFVSLWVGKKLVVREETRGRLNFDLALDPSTLPEPEPRAAFTLRLTDERGAPVEAREISVDGRFTEGGRRGRASFVFASAGPGAYALEDVRAGDYVFVVKADGFASRVIGATLKAAPATNEATVVMRRPTAAIDVVVRGPDGAPRNGVKLALLDEDGRPLPYGEGGTTNAEGRAALGPVAEGAYTLLADAKGLAPAGRRIVAKGARTATTLDLVGGVKVVIDPEGSSGPFTFRFVDARRTVLADGAVNGSRTYCDETTVLLEPGPCVVEVRCPGFATASVAFDAAEGVRVKVPLTRP